MTLLVDFSGDVHLVKTGRNECRNTNRNCPVLATPILSFVFLFIMKENINGATGTIVLRILACRPVIEPTHFRTASGRSTSVPCSIVANVS